MSWAFWLIVGGLLLGTSAGRGSLAAPVHVGVMAPRWAIWSAALRAAPLTCAAPRPETGGAI